MTLHLFAIFISTLEPDYKRYWFCSKDLTLGHFDTCKVHVTKFNIKIVNKAYKKHPVSLLQSPGPGDDWLQARCQVLQTVKTRENKNLFYCYNLLKWKSHSFQSHKRQYANPFQNTNKYRFVICTQKHLTKSDVDVKPYAVFNYQYLDSLELLYWPKTKVWGLNNALHSETIKLPNPCL